MFPISFPAKWLLSAAAAAACLLGPVSAALGQKGVFRPGYVVLASAPTDTLRGEIDLYRAGRTQPQVLFRNAQQPARSYGLDEVQAAGDESGLHYRRCQVPRGENNVLAMLQVLVAGPASLYSDPTGQLPAHFYLDKPGRSPMPLKREQFAQVLQTAFADCPTLNTEVVYAGRYVYSVADLRRYVVAYNRCVHPQARVQSPEVAKTAAAGASPTRLSGKDRVRLGAQVGVARLGFFYPHMADDRPLPGPLTPVFGLLATLPLSNHFAVHTGFTHSSYRSDNSFDEPILGSGYTRRYRYQSKGSIIRWPLVMRITVRRPEAAWRPYAQAGIQMSYILGSELKTQISYPDPNVPLVGVSASETVDGLGRGMHGEIGLLFPYRKALLGVGFRGETTNGFPVRGRFFLTDFNQLTFALTYYH